MFNQWRQSKNNVTVDIKGKILAFNYYESLYSPMATASFVEIDTGGTVGSFKDDFAATFKDGLPVTGFEQVRVKVTWIYSIIRLDKRR